MTAKRDSFCNVGESIAAKIGVNLHRQKHHPLNIIKTTIEGYFDKLHSQYGCVSRRVLTSSCMDRMG